jgi:hypothetical protein
MDIIVGQNLKKGERMLKKLSLAALIAMGSVSFASATPLTEAIKNVNFGGYLRVRIYNDDPKNASAENRYRTTALFKFSVPVSEELKFNTAYAFDWSIYSDGTTWNDAAGGRAKNKKASPAPAPGNVKFFLQYSKDNLTALVGKIPVPTPVTATGVGEATAAGAIALYKVNDNVTLAAAALDAMVGTDLVTVGGKNTYAGAIIFNKDNISAEAWYFNVKDIIDSDIVLRATYKMPDNGLTLHADFATADLDDSISSKTQTYFNVSAKYAKDQICAKLGYAKTGKDGGVVALDGDSPIASVLPTQQKTGIANTTDTSAIYGKVGYMVDPKTNVYGAVSVINDDSAANKDYNEYVVGVNYKYTKKMNIAAYYSILDGSNGAKNDDNNEARVEFKYSF